MHCEIAKGCTFNKGNCALNCQPIEEACQGCDRAVGNYCSSCVNPAQKWSHGKICNLASHVKKATDGGSERKLNPLKAAKRRAAGKLADKTPTKPVNKPAKEATPQEATP